jgi:hypothetical protein
MTFPFFIKREKEYILDNKRRRRRRRGIEKDIMDMNIYTMSLRRSVN